MIELLVGMIVFAILGVLFTTILINAMHSSRRTEVRDKAQRAVVLATDQLQDDLRAARAPQRGPLYVRSPDVLREFLLFRQPTPHDIHDITAGSATRLVFQANVDSSAGLECVTWQLGQGNTLDRVVRAHTPGCSGDGGTVLSHSQLMRRQSQVRPGTPVLPFTYRMLQQPQVGRDVEVDPDACTTVELTPQGAMTMPQLDSVVGVRLDMSSFVVEDGSHSDEELRTFSTLASRQAPGYRYALGCLS